jgi:TetR/AcrR family transcriptional repressor of nem operon
MVGIEIAMRQRKKQPAQTRQALLDAADLSFSRQGYAATGLGGLVAQAGLTKGGLFHHFPDKKALAKAWIDDRLSPNIQQDWILPLAEVQSLDAFQQFCRLRILAIQPDDSLSALVAITAEIAATDDSAADSLELVFSAWRSAIAALLERGKADGWIHPSIQPANESALMVSMIAGFSVTAKSGRDREMLRHACNALDGYLETLRAQSS